MESITYEEALSRYGAVSIATVGVSMRPLIREGRDRVLVARLTTPPKRFDTVLFTRPNAGKNDYVLHRILRVHADGNYFIAGDNCADGETVAPERILGVLTTVYRRGRECRVTDFCYRLYVALWCKPYHVRFLFLRALAKIKAAARRAKRLFTKQ